MYADSKIKLFMMTAELQRRLHAAGSTTDVFSVHPGQSNICLHISKRVLRLRVMCVQSVPSG